MLSIIVAVAENNIIGKNNGLIWHLPEDLKRFKQLTTGKTIIMGRKTFESLGRLLPNRKHVVLTKDSKLEIEDEMLEVVHDIKELDKYIQSEEECFVIGGGVIYQLLLPVCQKLYITKIQKSFEGDTYFPKINLDEWEIVQQEKGRKDEKNPYDYEFIDYIRK